MDKYVEDCLGAIRSVPVSLSYVKEKSVTEPWAFNIKLYSLGIVDRLEYLYHHSGGASLAI
jgi:hypothetical protein